MADKTNYALHAGPTACLDHAPTLEQIVREELAAVSKVRDVNVSDENGELVVRIGMDHPDRASRYQVFDKQAYLAQLFPERVFDFTLIHAV